MRIPLLPTLFKAAATRGVPLADVERILSRGQCVHRVEYWAAPGTRARVVVVNGRAASCYVPDPARHGTKNGDLRTAQVNAELAAEAIAPGSPGE